jgi:hypothetical protein
MKSSKGGLIIQKLLRITRKIIFSHAVNCLFQRWPVYLGDDILDSGYAEVGFLIDGSGHFNHERKSFIPTSQVITNKALMS